MKIRMFTILLVLVYAFFHFSPQIAEALEDGVEETEELEESEESKEAIEEVIEEGEADQTVEDPDALIEEQLEEEGETKETVNDDLVEKELEEKANEIDENSIKESNSNEDILDTPKLEQENTDQTIIQFRTVSSGEPLLKNGVRDSRVKKLKSDLNKLGFPVPGNGTTLYGPDTAKKVKEFQSYYGLGNDGIAGEATLAKINSILSSPLQNGKRHSSTIKLKADLEKVGFKVPGKGTNLYGKDTEKRVKDFQKHYGLIVNGIADEVTLAKIAALLPSELQNGVRHADVKKLKANLKKLGFTVPGSGTTLFGKDTEQKVREFQSYYGLQVDGVAGKGTLAKINSILSSPLQNGKRHSNTIKLKADLEKVGFKVPGKGTNLYGKDTEKRVKDFQKHYGLKVNGIADEVTLAKIAALLPSELQNGVRHADVKKLKANLKKLGFSVPGNGTTLFGKGTEQKVREFQSYYGLQVDGVAGKGTLAKIDSILSSPLQNGKRHSNTIKLKADLEKVGFKVPGKGTNLYGKDTEKVVKDFQKQHGLRVNGIADEVTLKKIESLVSALPTGLQNGVRHKDVKKLKADLGRLGFPVPGNGTTYFGRDTENKIKEFQTHYGLKINGVADEATLAKIKKVLASPLQNGQRHKDTIKLKNDLVKVGYPVPGDGTNYFGKGTERQVKAYQKSKLLPISGIADEGTLAAIATDIKQLQVPTYNKYDITLTQALNIQMNQLQQTDKYRNEKAYVHGDYINFIGLISANNSNLRSKSSTKSTRAYKGLNKGAKVVIVKEVKGEKFRSSNVWYEVIYNDKTVYAHSSILNASTTIVKATTNVNIRAETNSNNGTKIYGILKKGEEVGIVKKSGAWYEINNNRWINPTSAHVEQYLNPNNKDQFQHLLLSSSVGVSASQLNNVLKGKGVLNGLGQAFIDGGTVHSVNEIYLISHALLETGHGTSKLAAGIEVGLNSNGNPVVVTTSNRSSLKSIKTTYNVFGIEAADADPNRLGAIHAYKEEWFTPEAAIIGGAEFIGERYIHNAFQQNTLYKMRWNPASPGYPQYATDIAWAVKQVTQIQNMYKLLDDPLLQFNIAQYR